MHTLVRQHAADVTQGGRSAYRRHCTRGLLSGARGGGPRHKDGCLVVKGQQRRVALRLLQPQARDLRRAMTHGAGTAVLAMRHRGSHMR